METEDSVLGTLLPVIPHLNLSREPRLWEQVHQGSGCHGLTHRACWGWPGDKEEPKSQANGKPVGGEPGRGQTDNADV